MRAAPFLAPLDSCVQNSQNISDSHMDLDLAASSLSAEATNGRQLLAMGGGSFVFQGMKMLTSISGVRPFLSSLFALGAEAAAFGGLHRVLSHHVENDESFFESWRRDVVHFGLCKTLNHSFISQNILFRHGIQALGMSLGLEVSSKLGWTSQAQESFAQSLFHSLATSVALEAGTSLTQRFTARRLGLLQNSLQNAHRLSEKAVAESASTSPVFFSQDFHHLPRKMLIFGHRGVRWENLRGEGPHTPESAAPENTMLSFEQAIRMGADGVEFDVLITADGEAVVTHGEIDRFSGGSLSRPVSSHTLAILRAANVAAYYKGPGNFGPQSIPLLSEVLERFQKPDASAYLLNLEIKSEGFLGQGLEVVPQVISQLRHASMTERVVVSSFDPKVLVRMRELAPEIRRGLLLDSDPFPGFIAADEAMAQWLERVDPYSLHPENVLLNDAFVENARQQQRKVFVWFIKDPDVAELRRLHAWSVDAVIVDDPANAGKILSKGFTES